MLSPPPLACSHLPLNLTLLSPLCWEKLWVCSLLRQIIPGLCLLSYPPASLFSAGLLHPLHLSATKSMSCTNVVPLLHVQQQGEGQILTVRRQQNTTSCLDFEFPPSINRKKPFICMEFSHTQSLIMAKVTGWKAFCPLVRRDDSLRYAEIQTGWSAPRTSNSVGAEML